MFGTVSLAIATFAIATSLSVPLAAPPSAAAGEAEIGVDVPDVAALQKVPDKLKYGDEGPWVALLNQKLRAAGFNANDGDQFRGKTRQAVYAFKKHYELDRNGMILPEHWSLLDKKIVLPYRPELNRVEVNLKKQVLYLVEDGEVEMVVAVSSGNGARYIGEGGHEDIANTPEGKFAFTRKVAGLRVSYLGELWNPFYFTGGYAIHGSPSVPNYPASHGCIRTAMWDMKILKERFEIGQTVYVYGKRKPEPVAPTVEPLAVDAI